MKIGIIREGKAPPDSRVLFTPSQCIALQDKYNIEFIKTDNIGAENDDINKRKIKEESSIKQFLTNIEEYNLNSESDIFNWLFTHHNAYNTIGMINHKTNTSTQNVNNNDLTLY